jgi:Mitochondrial carrier protein
MQQLESRFETVADLRSVVEKGGGGLGVSYRVSGIAAFIASAVSTAIVHPLDTLKTRIQAKASSANPGVAVDLTNLYSGIQSNILKEGALEPFACHFRGSRVVCFRILRVAGGY